jgi:hypothetical protein
VKGWGMGDGWRRGMAGFWGMWEGLVGCEDRTLLT